MRSNYWSIGVMYKKGAAMGALVVYSPELFIGVKKRQCAIRQHGGG